MLESYKINVIAIWENYAIKSQLLINILADIKGYMGNIKSGVFLHVIAKFTSFGIFADNLGQQSHRDKFACQNFNSRMAYNKLSLVLRRLRSFGSMNLNFECCF